MNIKEALATLGVDRVIWIDDHFNESPGALGRMLASNIEITKACAFAELSDAIEIFDYSEDEATSRIIQILTDMSPERRELILTTYLQKEDEREPGAVKELKTSEVDVVCQTLGIQAEDRWPFEQYLSKIQALCATGDENICYMIDLKDSNGGPNDKTGLQVVATLHAQGSKGTTFILTHEADIGSEAQLEEVLIKELDRMNVEVPICVVSKMRMAPHGHSTAEVEESLRIAIKRAGIRKNIFEVLTLTREKVTKSLNKAMREFNRISPEQFEKFAVEKAYNEGVSETHVIERAVTARLSREIRKLFATDRGMAVATNLRRLRSIPLDPSAMEPDPRLADFHDAEVWEDEKFLNSSFAQLACGDVFAHPDKKTAWYVLLAAPCDLALRNDRTRDLETGTLVPLRPLVDGVRDADRLYKLPVTLKGKRWYCDWKETAPVRLSILDLSTFRSDGLVRFDANQAIPESLMDAQARVYEERTGHWSALAIQAAKLRDDLKSAYKNELQLLFAPPDGFNPIADSQILLGDKGKAVVWPLKRIGRIRMPYASAMFSSYLNRMGRQAFDIDYIGMTEPAKPQKPAVVQSEALTE